MLGAAGSVQAVAQLLIGSWTRSPFAIMLDQRVAHQDPFLATPWPGEKETTIRLPSTAAKLVRFLRQDNLRICKPALRAIGNIVCAEDDCDLTQNMIDLGVVPLLAALVQSPTREIQKEVCWTLSNVGAGSHTQIQALLDSGCLLTTVFGIALNATADVGVRTEACWIVLNATSCGSDCQVETLVRSGAARVLCSMMRDPALVMMALEGIEKILQVSLGYCTIN
jgi:importin subunit alpha-1